MISARFGIEFRYNNRNAQLFMSQAGDGPGVLYDFSLRTDFSPHVDIDTLRSEATTAHTKSISTLCSVHPRRELEPKAQTCSV
jgi:hypothetical protein